jgi:hypothetical protein
MSSNIAIFYNVLQINAWEKLFEEQIVKMQQSGVYDAADYIHFGVNGSIPLPFDLIKVNVTKRNIRTDTEADTLMDLYRFSVKNPNHKILYVHAKGVTHSGSNKQYEQNVSLWRNYLEYFNIELWQECISLLNEYDCVGTEWETTAKIANVLVESPHYAGNFWWANANYISKLDPNFLYVNNNWPRWQSEFWIGTGNPKYYNFYNTNKNKYTTAIDPSEYRRN